jgi:hypothetical protein
MEGDRPGQANICRAGVRQGDEYSHNRKHTRKNPDFKVKEFISLKFYG